MVKPRIYASYTKITSARQAHAIIRKAAKSGPCALDFETTSLRPETGRVRLVQLCNTKVRAVIDFDKCGGFKKFAKDFKLGKWIVFYSGFEGRWFIDAGVPDITLYDVGHLRRAILGGGGLKLSMMAQWDLEIPVDKTEQTSDWSKPKLTAKQLKYAFKDAAVTWALWRYWTERATEGHMKAFRLINDMWPAVVEMEESGMMLDSQQHKKLIAQWQKDQVKALKKLRDLVSEDEVKNVNSDAQWNDYFAQRLPDSFLQGWPRTEKTGRLSMKREHLSMLGGLVHGTPLAKFFEALTYYKWLTKYLSSFGETLLNAAELNGDSRIHASFRIAAAKTCRFSCAGPNLQQVPRNRADKFDNVRQSFIAPPGRKLVSLDYSGIELRVLALQSGDKQLLEDVVYGDVHAEVAAVVAGRKIDKKKPKDKELRSSAKPISFLIIYGGAAYGLASSMKVSPDTAQDYIDFWADRYPEAFNYRHIMQTEARKSGFLPMVDGGTIYVGKRADLPKCANYPVQRGALSIMARAIIRHKSSLDDLRARKKQRKTLLLSTIHDALIDEAANRDCTPLLKVMEKDMTQAYLDIFPGAPIDRLVEGGSGTCWGTLE